MSEQDLADLARISQGPDGTSGELAAARPAEALNKSHLGDAALEAEFADNPDTSGRVDVPPAGSIDMSEFEKQFEAGNDEAK